MPLQSVAVLGSTGSVGKHTLEVIALHSTRFNVHLLCANSSVDLIFEQCRQFQPALVFMQQEPAAEQLHTLITQAGLATKVLHGEAALCEALGSTDVDIVVAGIVGAAGLMSTLAAAQAGKRVLLANKESLVMSGDLLMQSAKASGAQIMPTDSEHNAIFQCLFGPDARANTVGVEKIMLTASGGPLRVCTKEQLAVVTPQQALKHPNWSMGPKISIDSATMMNKGLELIEACTLFDKTLQDIEVIVHPESIIHSMVQYRDGSVLAQMGPPDMRVPIAHGLSWPERISSGVTPLDFTSLSALHFEKPDTDRFPCLRMAAEAQATGGTAPTVLNAANEIAVEAFLDGFVSFLQLADTVEYTLSTVKISPATDLSTIIEADKEARIIAQTRINALPA